MIKWYQVPIETADIKKYRRDYPNHDISEEQTDIEFYLEKEHGIDIWDCDDDILMKKPE
jgi:hypothetical protein